MGASVGRVVVLFVGVAGAASGATPRTGTASVAARWTPDGVHAEVHLSRAVARFTFEDAPVVREGDVEILTDGLTWADDALTVTAARPFRRFEVLIRPMVRERDAKYPAVFRVGEGAVLYAPTLAGDPAEWRTRLEVVAGPGQVVAPADGPASGGSVFVGPADHVTRAGALIVAPPDTPLALRDAAVSELGAAMAFYTEALGVALPAPPVLVLAQGGDGHGQVGDVTPGPFVSLRFYGATYGPPDADARATLSRFVSHETFHFWNGSWARPSEDTPTWLHEGGADYAALLSAHHTGALDEAGVGAALGDALTTCRDALLQRGDVSMDSLGFLPQQVRYPCGLVLQWSAALSVRRAGRDGVLPVWEYLMEVALARDDHTYTLADFLGAPGMGDAVPVVELLTATSGPARWEALVEALRALGAEIRTAPTGDTRRNALLFHLLAQNCPGAGSMGFHLEDGRVRLQAEPTCGALSDVVLTSVAGGDPLAPDEAAYRRAQEACAANRSVPVGLEDGARVEVPCGRPLPDARVAFAVDRWR